MDRLQTRLNELLSVVETRELTPAERAEVDDLKARVANLEQTVEADAAGDGEPGTPAPAKRMVQPWVHARKESRALGNPGDRNFAGWIRAVSPYATDADVRAASMVGPTHGLEMRIDPALAIKTTAGGDHLISQGFNTAFIEELKYSTPWLTSGANVINTSTDGKLRIPVVNDSANEGHLIDEKVKDAELPPTLSEIALEVGTISSKLVACSWESMQDSSVNLPQLLGRVLGARIGRTLDRQISTGTAAPFYGFFKQTVDGSQKLDVATSGKVTVADLIKLIGKLDRSYTGNLGSVNSGLRWVMNSATLTELLSETAVGSGEFLLADPEAGSGARILGIPVVVANYADDNAAGKSPVWLADLSRNLYIRQHLTISLRRSSDFAFDQRADTFVALARYGCAIADTKAVACLVGK